MINMRLKVDKEGKNALSALEDHNNSSISLHASSERPDSPQRLYRKVDILDLMIFNIIRISNKICIEGSNGKGFSQRKALA
jgi:hypothetical protein